MKLTDKEIKAAKPKEKAYKLSDGGGMYLEVAPNGGKYWRLKYRYLGKEKRLALGVYDIVTLKEARERRDEAKKIIAAGQDPAKVKKQVKKQAVIDNGNTFEVIAREWHAHKIDEWKPEHAKTIINRLEKDVFPVIGSCPIKELTSKNIADLAQSIQKRGANELAKRVIQMCKHIIHYAIMTGRATENPAELLKGFIKPKPKKHFAAFDYRELPQFLKVLEKNDAYLKPLTIQAVKLMMLTFVRTGELIKAEWREFDFEEKIWCIPATRMKMNKDHLVPLSKQTIEILQLIRSLHNNEIYVFPSRDNSKNHMSNNTILMALRRMGYAGVMTGHGFRSLAMSTIMERLGYRYEIPNVQLAHSKRGDVDKAYNRALFLDERKTMMQDWADYIDDLRGN